MTGRPHRCWTQISSAGARDTGCFSLATHEAPRALIERIRARGGVALVQPYLSSIDRRGETALVYFGGELSYVLRKRALLYPDEVAPMAREGLGFQLGVAQAMFEEDLVVPGEADPAERELAERVLAELTDRFDTDSPTLGSLPASVSGFAESYRHQRA